MKGSDDLAIQTDIFYTRLTSFYSVSLSELRVYRHHIRNVSLMGILSEAFDTVLKRAKSNCEVRVGRHGTSMSLAVPIKLAVTNPPYLELSMHQDYSGQAY